MDKYEYKIRSEEIKSLIAEGAYAEAAEIADTIDWRRVKSVMMLCTVSDLYKVNRRYEDAKNMLLLAYEKKPGGRTICYSLCELCIKTEEFVQALNYFKEFTQVAPRDTGRYILQYKLYEAQEVSLEERIGVLEELKKRDYREKWAYELAYLYHRVGLGTRCVEECDELILWFGEGKYVVKAMELKMLHQPLTPAQQEVYDRRFEEAVPGEPEPEEQDSYEEDYGQQNGQDGDYGWQPEEQGPEEDGRQEPGYTEGDALEPEQPDELDIQVKTVDVGQYNTINLQAELAAGLQEVLGADGSVQAGALPAEGASGAPEDVGYQDVGEEEIEESEVFFGATGEIDDAFLAEEGTFEESEPEPETVKWQDSYAALEHAEGPDAEEARAETDREDVDADIDARRSPEQHAEKTEEAQIDIQPPREMAEVLSQEADGQISIVLPENATAEKQITGQMKIADILAEWERIKKASEAKCQEEVRKHVLSQTGPMFTEFDAAVRDGLLEQLEKGEAGQTQAEGREAQGLSEAGRQDSTTESYTESESTDGMAYSDGADGQGTETGAEPEAIEEDGTRPEYVEEVGYSDEEAEGINELRRAVHTLHAEGRPDVFPSTVSAELSECVYEAFDSKEMGVIAALSGGEVWGYAVVEYTEKPASPYTLPMGYYHVAELGVDEHRRRQGVARALMDFMKEDAVRRGFPRIELDLWEFNRDALRFYEAAGFSTYRRHMELWLEEEKS